MDISGSIDAAKLMTGIAEMILQSIIPFLTTTRGWPVVGIISFLRTSSSLSGTLV